MDVDKPHQLEMLREDLAKQERKENAKAKRVTTSAKAKTQKTTSKRSNGAKKDVALADTGTLLKPKAKSKAR